MTNLRFVAILTGAAIAVAATPAFAAQCNHKGGFPGFLNDFKKEAGSKGISKRSLDSLDGLTVDDKVLASDRRQHIFKLSFEEFSAKLISKPRFAKGQQMMKEHADALKKIEKTYGVPGGVIVGIWGLETDYGTNLGKMSVVRSVATLAYDCRRTDKFQGELLDALRIIDRGDMAAADMRGDWAGEIGQTQFLPSSYMKYAVSYSGRGKPDLIHNKSDVLASTANYLSQHGWQRGKGWGPDEPNFAAIKEWNKADVYARTIALFGQRLQGQSSQAAEQPAPAKKDNAMKGKRASR